MTDYAICFDFPEMDDPWFAARIGVAHDPSLGWTTNLSNALLFDTEADAERMLQNGYGETARKWGAVVEVGHG